MPPTRDELLERHLNLLREVKRLEKLDSSNPWILDGIRVAKIQMKEIKRSLI